ncbi:MAG: LysM peptidoglycan-binding domain-containing protein [Bacteroidota bacterium]|nr:LysM peptidoglycan-binding domain-containing protein [Bacteroidota bacterium]
MTHRIASAALILGALLFWAGQSAFAQEERMTEEQAVKKIQQLEQRVGELKRQETTLEAQLTQKNQLLKEKQAEHEKCIDELYALVGATRSDVDAYESRLRRLENKISELLRLSPMDLLSRKSEVDEVEREYTSLAGNKISLLPAFYDRVQRVGENIKVLRDTLAKAEKTYTVGTWARDRDCLWNIAKKPDIYGDAFRWPKIWQKNRDQIRNPDLIYPGQVLKIPAPAPLTPEEESAARKYYRQKREAAAAGGVPEERKAPETINK